MGAYHFGRQDYAAAVAEYKKATAINPQFSQPYNQMGYAYRFMGKNAEAEQAFKKYIELIPGDPNPYDSYAELLMKLGRFDESIKSYEKALSVDPNFVASYIGIGNNRVFLGQPRRGARKLRAAGRGRAQRRRAAAGALLDRAVVRARGGHGQGAGRAREDGGHRPRRARTSPRMSGTYNQMGNILLEAGRVDDAAARFKEQVAAMEKAEVAAQVKDATRRQHLFDEARVALARKDLAARQGQGGRVRDGGGGQEDPVRGPAEPRAGGPHRPRREATTRSRSPSSAQANQQDPRVVYLLATALDRQGRLAGGEGRRGAGRGLERAVEHVRLRARQGAGHGHGEEELKKRLVPPERVHRLQVRRLPGGIEPEPEAHRGAVDEAGRAASRATARSAIRPGAGSRTSPTTPSSAAQHPARWR